MNVRDLEWVLEIARCGGLQRAAKSLGQSPGNISTRLGALEAEVGVQIFSRTGAGLIANERAKDFFQHIERALLEIAAARASLDCGVVTGKLTVAAMESTAAVRLPTVLSKLLELHPSLAIEVQAGTSQAGIDLLLAGDVEACFVADPPDNDVYEQTPAFRETLKLITPSTMRDFKSLQRGKAYNLLAFASGCSYRRRLERWFHNEIGITARFTQLASYQAIIKCVSDGMGIALVPESVLAISNDSRNILVHSIPNEYGEVIVSLVTKKHPFNAKVAALRECSKLLTHNVPLS